MAWKTNPELRERIYDFVVSYADEKDGPTPSKLEIAKNLHLPYSTVYYHVLKLKAAHLLDEEDGKLLVVGSAWYAPGEFPD